MTQNVRPSFAEHPVALGSFASWLRLIRNSRGIDRAYFLRAGFVALTTLVTSPLRVWERLRYGAKIRSTSLHSSPVFIIGHWRSGTTYLHNLICQDANFGHLSTFQAMAPGFCIIGDKHIKPALASLARKRYPTRLIDNIPLAFDSPQEDEFALASLTPHSFLHAFSFPRHAHDFFRKYVLFEELPESERSQWIDTYLELMRKTTLMCQGKRLVIKNCAHSARIQTLLELFPDAKFIHIHRNPYEVYLSTIHMHKTVLPRSQLQDAPPEHIAENVLQFYTQLMERYIADRASIPDGNLVEIRYEELERAPLDQLRFIYERLSLPGFVNAEPGVRAYIESVSDYKKNAYTLDEPVIANVNEHWAWLFDVLGYDRIESSPQLVVNSGG